MNPAELEKHLKDVFLVWTVIIAASWLFGMLGRKIGQPMAVGEIFAGLLLGPSLLGKIWPASQELFGSVKEPLELLGEIGLILLLFQVGMEFDFGHVRSRSKTVTAVSLMGIIAPCLGGLLIGRWLHQNFASDKNFFGFQLFVCVALSITSLPVMARMLLEMKLERTPLGVLAVSAAALDDVAGWILLAVVTSLATAGFAWQPLVLQICGLVALAAFVLLVLGPALRALWRRLKTDEDNLPHSFLAVLLIALFLCCLATSLLGIFLIFGAFLLGVALHQEEGIVAAWRSRFASFVLVALVPVFFAKTGLRTDIGSLQTGLQWAGAALVMVVATAGKFGGCWLGARVSGQSQKESLSIAALMNTRALMGLIAINVGYELKLLPPELFTMFVIMALLTTAITGPMLALWLPKELRNLAPGKAYNREKFGGAAEIGKQSGDLTF